MTDPQHPGAFPPPVPPAYSQNPPGAPDAPAVGGRYAPPTGAYTAPLGGYDASTAGYGPAPVSGPRSGALGAVSLVLALVAAVVASIVGAVAFGAIGSGMSSSLMYADTSDLGFLSPVRGDVLWAEISFWTGTVLGCAGLVLGIIAIVQRRGRGQGIAAVIIAALGPILYGIAAVIALSVGAGTALATYA